MSAFLVAYHEARHGTMAWLCGWRLTSITLGRQGHVGWCVSQSPADAPLEQLMLVTLAGISGEHEPYSSHSDLHVASRKYDRWCRAHFPQLGPQPPFTARLQGFLRDCRLVLGDYGLRIQRVADTLLRKKRLDQYDLADLLPSLPRERVVTPPRPAAHAHQTRRSRSLAARTPVLDLEVQEAQYWLMAEAYHRRQGRHA
jgi:hypothetical protein